MVERVMRAISATEKAARVKVGKTHAPGSCEPAAGSHCSLMANTTISISPNQYAGIEMPNNMSAEIARSSRRL